MMHQVLYIVQLPNEEGDMHIIALGASWYALWKKLWSQSCLFYFLYNPFLNFFIYLL